MSIPQKANQERASGEKATPRLEDLIPIAVVIGAGCESCAERMVERALGQGCDRPVVGRTLKIVEHLRWQGCFLEAVGPEVIGRMGVALEAGKSAFRKADSCANTGQNQGSSTETQCRCENPGERS